MDCDLIRFINEWPISDRSFDSCTSTKCNQNSFPGFWGKVCGKVDGKASLFAVTFCTSFKVRLMSLILNTCLETHQKKAKLLLVVLCNGLCWRASWQLASRVYLHQALQRWPNCSALYLFLAQSTAFQWLITPSFWGGPVFRTRHTDRLSWRRVFVFFYQLHEDITRIVPHILPQLFPTISFPTYFSLSILTSYIV